MMRNDDILLLGPYIGDFEYELIIFRPFITWLYNLINWDNCYISSHLNRRFLYDFIDDDYYIPVYEFLSRDEENQNKLCHNLITQKEFNSIIDKNVKDEIVKKNKCMKKNIIQLNTSYTKFIQPYSLDNKDFYKIKFEKENPVDIVYIPDKKEDLEISLKILNFLDENYSNNFIVVGDEKCWFQEKNWIKENRADYFENVYKIIVNKVSNANIVITPCSHWTFLSNLQGTPVFSWSVTDEENISFFKSDDIYGFGNKNMILNIDKKNLIDQIKFFLNWI